MATQKFANFNDFLKMHTDTTFATLQSNKFISNEVENN